MVTGARAAHTHTHLAADPGIAAAAAAAAPEEPRVGASWRVGERRVASFPWNTIIPIFLHYAEGKMLPQGLQDTPTEYPLSAGATFGSLVIDETSPTPYSDATQVRTYSSTLNFVAGVKFRREES